MNLDQFWSIIDKGKDSTEPAEIVADELRNLPAEGVASYQEHFDALFEQAYRWDLWGAAYIIEGGCSDDGFIDFRYGLISKGRDVYEKALANPDSLADLPTGEEEDVEIGDELFGYVALEVYEEKTGNQMPRRQYAALDNPAGEDWDFDDDEENARRLPKLSKKYSEHYGYSDPTRPATIPPSPEKKPWWKLW